MDIKKEYSCLSKNVLVSSKSINIDKSFQENLEGYLDDIFKIIKCDCHSFVTSFDINDNTCFANGKIEIVLTYINEQNEIVYTEFTEDFCEKIIVDNLSENAFGYAVCCDRYTNHRIINQRRLDIHFTFELQYKIYDKVSFPCISSCESSKLHLHKVKEHNVENALIKSIEFDEEFFLNSDSTGIKRVINYSAQIKLVESKAIKNKLYVKASIELKCLYTNNNDEIESVVHSFEISKIFDIADIDNASSCFVNIYEGCIFVKAKSGDNGGRIEVYGDTCLTILIVSQQERLIATDGYIIGKKVENNYSKYLCHKAEENLSVTTKEKISINSSSKIKRVVDLWLYALSVKKKNNKLCIEMLIKLICETPEGVFEFSSYTKIIELEKDIFNPIFLCSKINSFDFNILGDDEININLDISINGCLCKEQEMNVLSDINALDTQINSPALTLYFGKQKEALWDIAKCFSSDIELIKKENEIKTDVLDTNKVLIIPGI